jgi:hypothetical protein
MDSLCFVGRPDPSMTYWLANGRAPKGPFTSEVSLTFNPENLAVKSVHDHWTVVDGDRIVLDCGKKRDEADLSRKIIRHYGFTHLCYLARPGEVYHMFVGPPIPPFHYWRK